MISASYIESGNIKNVAKAGSNDFIPIKKVTFVKFDENSYLDDYAYIAEIPASIWRENGKTYAYPLLFYDYFKPSNKYELSLNSSQGIKYFMEDWIEYCNGLDEAEYINMNAEYKAKHYSFINSTDYYDAAAKIALHHWKRSNACVVAYAGDFGRKKKVEGERQI